jgi:hypothetical protein
VNTNIGLSFCQLEECTSNVEGLALREMAYSKKVGSPHV